MHCSDLQHVFLFVDAPEAIAVESVSRLWSVSMETVSCRVWSNLCNVYGIRVDLTLQDEMHPKRIFADWTRVLRAERAPSAALHRRDRQTTTDHAIADDLMRATTHFYETAPLLTDKSKDALARRHVQVLQRHSVDLEHTVSHELPQRVACCRSTTSALDERMRKVLPEILDDLERRVDTTIEDTAALNKCEDWSVLFTKFERQCILKDVIAESGARERLTASLHLIRPIIHSVSPFLELEVALLELDQGTHHMHLQHCHHHDSSTGLTRFTFLQKLVPQWQYFKKSFPLGETYYDIKDALCCPNSSSIVGRGEKKVSTIFPHLNFQNVSIAELLTSVNHDPSLKKYFISSEAQWIWKKVVSRMM
eukprot:PhM_4_TR5324/c0_g1_i2/m.21808